jgi:hypothetical protein
MLNGQGLRLFVLCLHVGHEQGLSIVKTYDEKTLCPMLLTCYHYVHLVGKRCRSHR